MWLQKTLRLSPAVICFALLFPFSGTAQLFTSSINGLVTDPSQAAVAGAQVSVENDALADVRKTQTDAEGRYSFSQLQPGTYKVTVSAPGFRAYTATNVTLTASQALEFNIPLLVGDTSQTVEVTAATPLLQTENADKAVTLTAAQAESLPIPTHNALGLVAAQSGVVGVRGGIQSSPTAGDANMNRFALNGGRDESAAILVDGVSVTAGDWGGAIALPSLETVREFQVLRNTFDVQYGKTDGGVVSLVSKSGSNEFHGTGFEYLQNDVLNANTWTNNRAGLKKTVYQLNDFGANLGGPVWRAKRIFFFGNYEGVRQGAPSTLLTTVPTAAQRAGDFSQTFNSNGSLSQIFNPFTTQINASGQYTRSPFDGNRIPASYFNPVGVKILSLYPLPNLPGNAITGANNFASSGKVATNTNRTDLRGDWVATDKISFFGTVTRLSANQAIPAFFGNGADSNYASPTHTYRVLLNATYTPTPTWVVNVVGATSYWKQQQVSPSTSAGVNGSEIGLPSSLVSQFAANTLPAITLTNYGAIGNARYLFYILRNHDFQVNSSKQAGSHNLRFGFQLTVQQLNDNDNSSAGFNFNRGLTSGPIAASDSSSSGDAAASALLGAFASGSSTQNIVPASTQKYVAFYGQDTWRVNARLTVNYGLRYEIQLPRTERYNRMNYFDFQAASPLAQQTGLPLVGGLVFRNSDNRNYWNTDYKDFAPRIGLAYKLTDKLVFRTGYGLFYSQAVTSAFGYSDGYSVTNQAVATVNNAGFVPANLISNPFPSGLQPAVGSSRGLLTDVGGPVNAWSLLHPTPYVQSYSADFQYQPLPNTVLEVGYQGTQGRKLPIGYSLNINQLNPAYLSRGTALNQPVNNPFSGIITSGPLAGAKIPQYQLLLPYPQFTSVNLSSDTPAASSGYNALTVKYSQRFKAGVTALLTYQWSKAIDDTSETQGWEIGDQARNVYNLSGERSISAHDVPQYFVSSIVWELPVGRGKRFGNHMNKVVDAVVGGWQVSSITTYSSGLPLQFSCPNTLGQYGFQACRPNITSLTNLALSNQTTQRWFNTSPSVISAPPAYTIGTAPRYTPNLRFGPLTNANLTVRKYFSLTERLRLAFQAAFYNLTNTPQYGRANTSVGSNIFGQVTGLAPGSNPRNIELGARLQF